MLQNQCFTSGIWHWKVKECVKNDMLPWEFYSQPTLLSWHGICVTFCDIFFYCELQTVKHTSRWYIRYSWNVLQNLQNKTEAKVSTQTQHMWNHDSVLCFNTIRKLNYLPMVSLVSFESLQLIWAPRNKFQHECIYAIHTNLSHTYVYYSLTQVLELLLMFY